jgi:predicted Zn-dependent protease
VQEVDSVFSVSIQAVDHNLYGESLEFLENRLRGQRGPAVARAGLERQPDSALLNVFLALYHNRKGEPGQASVHLDKVRSRSPELAQRYSYLADSSPARARAGGQEQTSLIWNSGE